MKKLLQKIFKYLAYLAAALVILLAVAVGIFRLMLPRLPEYQEEIKDWASAAIGMTVEFSDMNARWRFSGPEVSFFDAVLSQPDSDEAILTTQEVSIGVGLLRLISDRELVVDRIVLRGMTVDLRQDGDSNWLVQGRRLDELLGSGDDTSNFDGDVDIIGEDIYVNYEHPGSGQLVPFAVRTVAVTRNAEETGVDAQLELPEGFGGRLDISANQLTREVSGDLWRYYFEGQGLELAGWSRLRPAGLPEIAAGSANISLWLDMAGSEIQSATSNILVSGMRVTGPAATAPFGLQGSFEFSNEANGWLLAARDFRLTTVEEEWPRSSLQVRVNIEDDGAIGGVRATASYFKLDDLEYLAAWLPEDRRTKLNAIAPSGELHTLRADLTELQTERPLFDVTSDLIAVGFSADDNYPGMRGFSGRLRADRNGGRVEIESTDLLLDLGNHLPEPITFDDAFGTVIWRRSIEGIIVLSDSIRIRNADLDSESNLQISVPADGSSPVVDFESNWSIYDVGAMGRYLPVKFIKPALYDWLRSALKSGYVRTGTTRFNGALDKFPFDDGEGMFRIDARLENATLKYADTWPAAEFGHLDLIVENTRLYSNENSAVNLGNKVEDADIEIADLRQPVLNIEAFATGTLETIRQYAIQSPIHNVLGGQLDRVEVSGDASFDLSLTVPILDRLNFDFLTRIRSNDGTIRIKGFAAPVNALNGVVSISRDEIDSQQLTGRFLGQPVNISLARADQSNPAHSVVLEATGNATADALEAELGVPMDRIGRGAANYLATIRFPNGRAEQPGPLQIQVESDLDGFGIDLPAPMTKALDELMSLSATIVFDGEDRISTAGSLGDDYNWTFRFLKQNDVWDFDRGVLAVGGAMPANPEVRGLSIEGQTGTIRLQDWLNLARRDGSQNGLGSRIRSIDMQVADMFAIGQHYRDHHIQLNRSGQDWLVQVNGAQANGSVTIPYDFQSGRALSLNMERLVLPGNDESGEAAYVGFPDPRTLPSITINAAEFALGERELGALSIDLRHTARGLEADNLSMLHDAFTFAGSAGWIVDGNEEGGQRTSFQATLKSTNIEQTMLALNYTPGLVGDDMQLDFDVSWPGGPRQDFLSALDGTVRARVGEGQLEDVEPGAGRVFGLMSVVALPRRLSLDFRDVFDSGFAFDEISGDFRIVRGEAYTCNLSLTGPAADVGILGRVGLVSRDYSQAAVVSGNFGNTLPIAGLVVAGPQVAAALLIFSQLFKKPLQEVAQISYSIEGPWDNPIIDNTDSEQIARISNLAGCGDDAQ